jgi:hypothetical protein
MSTKLVNIDEEHILPIVKKRGRKPKKEKETETVKLEENIVIKIEEPSGSITETTNENINDENSDDDNSIHENISNTQDKPIGKKRGRKPKGGKIVQQITQLTNVAEIKPNVILHLKCSLNDLTLDKSHNDYLLEGYSFAKTNHAFLNTNSELVNNKNEDKLLIDNNNLQEFENESVKNKDATKDIWKKLKQLQHNLHTNNFEDKKSCCFWDTCEFDNPPIYIPKHYLNNSYQVYGCFCSPECAAAYLMEENIDSSVKFERYQLLNNIYSKIYDYTKNIKPSPNPYYVLDKYYGNLDIQEYRSLLRKERLFLIADKPLTRVMPELHEDNDDFIINNKIIPTNTIKLNKTNKKQTKTKILSEHFGMTN